jgi:tetratricopeptide (TPR) repeat protein
MKVDMPLIVTTNKPLHFAGMEPAEFERLCLWLVEKEGYLRPQHLGEGGNEQGRDITAYKITQDGEELWYFQCKRHKRLGAATLKKEVDKYNELAASYPNKRPTGIVFVTSTVLSARARDEVAAYCDEYGYAYDFWAPSELDMKVKKYPEIVQQFFSASYATAPVPRQLPPAPCDFTGRLSELAELTSAVAQGKTILSLYGMGGVGKTALALKLTEQLIHQYPDAQIYVELKGTSVEPLSITEAMLHVIRAYRPEAKPPETQGEVRGQYLSALHGQRAILLLDNAAGREHVDPLIPPLGCLLLVTSRERFHLPGLFSVHVETLPMEDSKAMLHAISPRVASQSGTIAELCGRLPMALRLAGSTLAERDDISTEDYVRRLSNSPRRLALAAPSLKLSYDLLIPEAQDLWRRLAVFPHTFAVEAAAMMWGLEFDIAAEVLSEFVRYSLLEWDVTNNRYHLHDLLRLFADECLKDDERHDSTARYVSYYGATLQEANSLYNLGKGATSRALSILDSEWDNIQAAQAWTMAHADSDDEAAEMCSSFSNVGAHLLALRQHPLERVRWLEAAIAAARKLGDRRAEGVHLANLGTTYTTMGEPRRAIELLEQALAIDGEFDDRQGRAATLGGLGSAYGALGDNMSAVDFYEQDLAILREFGDRHGEAFVLNNLGNLYSILGETNKAIRYFESALTLFYEFGDRYGQGGAMGSLGLLYSNLGDNLRAIELHEKALLISRELGDRHGEVQNLGNLAMAYYNLREYDRALEYNERQLKVARDCHDRQGEGSALGALGSVNYALGKDRAAIQCYEHALKIVRQTGDRFAENKILGNWGNVYLRSGDIQQALKYYQQQLAIARQIGDRLGEATALWNTGWAFKKLEDIVQAIFNSEAALKIYEEMDDWNNVARARKYLAEWRVQMR